MSASWLSKLLSGEIFSKDPIDNTTVDDKFRKSASENVYVKSFVDEEAKVASITKKAAITSLIDPDRRKQVSSLSDENLASILTELTLRSEGEYVNENWVIKYPEMWDSVKNDRKKAEDDLLAMIPKHTLSKTAALTQYWTVDSIDGKEAIVRLFDDLPKESDIQAQCTTLLSGKKSYSVGDEIKNTASVHVPVGESGVIEKMDPAAGKKFSIYCKFGGKGGYWLSPDDIEKVNGRLLLASLTTKAASEDLKKTVIDAVKQGKPYEETKALVSESYPDHELSESDYESAKKIIAGGDAEKTFSGDPQKTDDMKHRVPQPYRDADDQDYTPNTKDFGEIYHRDKMSPAKVSNQLSAFDKKASSATVDLVTDTVSLESFKAKAEEYGLRFDVIQESGPGGGWPEVRFSGDRDTLIRFLHTEYDQYASNDDIEYLIDEEKSASVSRKAEYGFEIGDEVICVKPNPNRKIPVPKMVGTVTFMDKDGVEVEFEDGDRNFFDPEELDRVASLTTMAKIRKQKDGYHVYSEKGKHMGGPYSLVKAKKRLQQIEMFKHMASSELKEYFLNKTSGYQPKRTPSKTESSDIEWGSEHFKLLMYFVDWLGSELPDPEKAPGVTKDQLRELCFTYMEEYPGFQREFELTQELEDEMVSHAAEFLDNHGYIVAKTISKFDKTAKGERAKIKDLRTRLDDSDDPQEIKHLCDAIDAIETRIEKDNERREKRKKEKSEKKDFSGSIPEVAKSASEDIKTISTPVEESEGKTCSMCGNPATFLVELSRGEEHDSGYFCNSCHADSFGGSDVEVPCGRCGTSLPADYAREHKGQCVECERSSKVDFSGDSTSTSTNLTNVPKMSAFDGVEPPGFSKDPNITETTGSDDEQFLSDVDEAAKLVEEKGGVIDDDLYAKFHLDRKDKGDVEDFIKAVEAKFPKTAAKTQYIDPDTEQVKKPEEMGIQPDQPNTPDEVSSGGKKYKKQMVDDSSSTSVTISASDDGRSLRSGV